MNIQIYIKSLTDYTNKTNSCNYRQVKKSEDLKSKHKNQLHFIYQNQTIKNKFNNLIGKNIKIVSENKIRKAK